MRGGDEDQEQLEEDQGSLRQPRHRATQPHLEIDFGAFIECLVHTMHSGRHLYCLLDEWSQKKMFLFQLNKTLNYRNGSSKWDRI